MLWKSPDEADAFVARYADTILRLAMTYSLSRADAQDICQDVFCRLLQSDLNFDSPAAERAYVLRSTINACKDLLKSAWRRKHTALDHASHIPAPASPDPDDTLLRTVQALPLRIGKSSTCTITRATTQTRLPTYSASLPLRCANA